MKQIIARYLRKLADWLAPIDPEPPVKVQGGGPGDTPPPPNNGGDQ